MRKSSELVHIVPKKIDKQGLSLFSLALSTKKKLTIGWLHYLSYLQLDVEPSGKISVFIDWRSTFGHFKSRARAAF